MGDDKYNLDILVVDDEEDLRFLYDIYLKRLTKGNIDLAANGREAFELVYQNHYDIILMDCHMPIMSGYEATRKIEELNLDIPIIAITSDKSNESQEKIHKAGADDIYFKPLNVDDLTKIVRKYSKL